MDDRIIRNANKIVIKVGSSTLTSKDGTIDKDFLENFILQVKTLMEQGKKIIIVSSGARIAGVATLGKWSRQQDIHYKQALCSIGQVELMDSYRRIFNKHGIHVGQILLTKEDFDHSERTLNIRNTLFTLIDEGVVPIVNENDTISVDEIKIGDNDMLAAYTTVVWGGELLTILSDIEGIYNCNPSENEDACLIDVVEDVDKLEDEISIGETSSFGTGGIKTKLKAAKMVNAYGIPMIVAHGKTKDIITQISAGEKKGTLFLPRNA
ncbi:glutamate 5-kinase [Gudongella sp. DL1XJH-153]|uniref:glutamate 5-kinase n=1 Tax=Gudongella sp. DL1XJH-153 TaxID=3409804 RepID=UPI003BB5D8A4